MRSDKPKLWLQTEAKFLKKNTRANTAHVGKHWWLLHQQKANLSLPGAAAIYCHMALFFRISCFLKIKLHFEKKASSCVYFPFYFLFVMIFAS